MMYFSIVSMNEKMYVNVFIKPKCIVMRNGFIVPGYDKNRKYENKKTAE